MMFHVEPWGWTWWGAGSCCGARPILRRCRASLAGGVRGCGDVPRGTLREGSARWGSRWCGRWACPIRWGGEGPGRRSNASAWRCSTWNPAVARGGVGSDDARRPNAARVAMPGRGRLSGYGAHHLFIRSDRRAGAPDPTYAALRPPAVRSARIAVARRQTRSARLVRRPERIRCRWSCTEDCIVRDPSGSIRYRSTRSRRRSTSALRGF